MDIDDVVEDFYVSAIQVCTVDENSIGIVGIQVTMKSEQTGEETVKPLDGYSGYCDPEQKAVMENDDCFSMLNLMFDADGYAVQFAYRRSSSPANGEYEAIGYGDGIYNPEMDISFEDGCMTGYNFSFGRDRRNLESVTNIRTLESM